MFGLKNSRYGLLDDRKQKKLFQVRNEQLKKGIMAQPENKAGSELFIEYQEAKLKSSLYKIITTPKGAEMTSKEKSTVSAIKNSPQVSDSRGDRNSASNRIRSFCSKPSEYKTNILKPDLEELFKSNPAGFFSGQKVSLMSKNMIFNLSTNYHVDKRDKTILVPKSRPSEDITSDLGRQSHASDLKERISATRLLFTTNKSRTSAKRDSQMDGSSFGQNVPNGEALHTEETSENDGENSVETSRSVIFINEKIKQLLPVTSL